MVGNVGSAFLSMDRSLLFLKIFYVTKFLFLEFGLTVSLCKKATNISLTESNLDNNRVGSVMNET